MFTQGLKKLIAKMSTGLEPQTSAKCIIYTSKGFLEVELWAKECHKTVKNFLQNAIDGAFNGKTIDRLLFQSVICSEEPQGGLDLPLECNTRLNFNRRGLVGLLPDSKGSFFITLKETPTLNNKATVFGKIVGGSIYNVVSISEGELKPDGETFLYPAVIDRIEITIPYFNNLLPKNTENKSGAKPLKKKLKKATKIKINYDDDDEEIEHDIIDIKIRPAHDVLNDKKLVPSSSSLHNDSGKVDGIQTSQDSDTSISEKKTADSGSSKFKISDITNKSPISSLSVKTVENEITARERKTLELLEAFQSNVKTSLFSHALDFSKKRGHEDDDDHE